MRTDDVANAQLLDLSEWLDDHSGRLGRSTEAILWSRCGKVAAEAGEVMDALSAWCGENPRKLATAGTEAIEYELLDVATAALGALVHLHNNEPDTDALALLRSHVARVHARANLGGAA